MPASRARRYAAVRCQFLAGLRGCGARIWAIVKNIQDVFNMMRAFAGGLTATALALFLDFDKKLPDKFHNQVRGR